MRRTAGVPAVRTEYLIVTPMMAAEWLRPECNSQNRRIKVDRVAKLVEVIRKGQWRITHQGIAFDINGKLIDGQHRLSAIVKSGIAITLAVSYGMDPSAIGVVDTGAAGRTLGDLIVIHEGWPYTEANRVASGCNMIERAVYGENMPLSYQDWCERYRDRFAVAISWARAIQENRLSRNASAPVVGAFMYCHVLGPEMVQQAHVDLSTGANLGEDDPIKVLRDFLVSENKTTFRVGREEVFQKAVTAIHARVKGKKLKRLYAGADRLAAVMKANGDQRKKDN